MLTNGEDMRSARCLERGTPGAGGDLGKRTGGNTGTAPEVYLTQGLPGAAQRYYLLALHACREVGSAAVPLGAKVIDDMAELAMSLGNYNDGINLCRTGIYALPQSEKQVRVELLGIESTAHARLGQASDAVRSAEACVEVWHEAEGEALPDFLHYLNQAEVDCHAANTYTQLALQAENPARWRAYADRGEFYTLRGQQTRPDGFDRGSVLDEIRLAKVRLSQRELPEALTVAADVLHFADPLRSSIVQDRLVRFHAEIVERHPDEASVQTFTDQLTEYLRKAAPVKLGDLVADRS